VAPILQNYVKDAKKNQLDLQGVKDKQ
jgi:hypothetical protein